MKSLLLISYRIYQVLVAFPLLLVLTILTSLTTIIGCTLADASFWSYHPARLWSKAMCRLLLLPVRIEGRENMQQGVSYVITPNHQGAFDIFLVYGYIGRRFKWMMKASLRRLPLIGKACEAAGHIFVDKSSRHGIETTMKQGRTVLQQGVSMVAFPEGERTLTGKIGAFRRGAFQLATELALPVLPVVIEGSYQVLPRQRGFWFVQWHPLTMRILPPIAPEGKTQEELRDLTRNAILHHFADHPA